MLYKTVRRKPALSANRGRRAPSGVRRPSAIGQARRALDETRTEASLDERLKAAARESFGLMGED